MNFDDQAGLRCKQVNTLLLNPMNRECVIVLYCDQIPDSLPLLAYEITSRKNALKIYSLLNNVPFIPMIVMGQKGGEGIPAGVPRRFPLACSLLATAVRFDQEFIDAVKMLTPLNKNINLVPHLLDLFDKSGLEIPDIQAENSPMYTRQFR